jgi:ABC-2 type transport system permease protein
MTPDTDTQTVSFLQQVRAFTMRSLRELFRSRVALFWAVGWPVFWYGLTMLFFIPDISGEALDIAKSTNAINFGMFGAFTVALVTFSENVSSDLQEKRYRKFRSMPISPLADMTGRFLAGYAMALVSFLTLLVVGYLHGGALAIGLVSIPVVLVALFLFAVVGMAIAVVVVSIINRGEYVTAITTTILLILFFVTGFNGVQPATVPEGSRWAVNVLPNSLATRVSIHHLTNFSPADTAEDAQLSPPDLPTEPEFLLLLVGWGVALLAVSGLVMWGRVYVGEAGE